MYRADYITDEPLDDTVLASEIASSVPGVNRSLRHELWRMDLKRRVRERREAERG